MRKVDGNSVIAVYRRGLAVPLVTGAAILLLTLVAVGGDKPAFVMLVLSVGILFAISVAIWHRGAAIFTSDSILVRPCVGRTLTIPLKGIKRAYIHPGATDEDGPTVRVQLLVGGEITVKVPKMEAVVELLNELAGKGLNAAQHAAEADR